MTRLCFVVQCGKALGKALGWMEYGKCGEWSFGDCVLFLRFGKIADKGHR